MTMDTSTQKTEPTGDRIADRLVAFAEQLAVLVGTVQPKAERWRDRAMLTRATYAGDTDGTLGHTG